MRPRFHPIPHKPQGFALVTALVFLVVLTVLGVTLMEGVTLEQRMAHNLREKERAIAAASDAVNGTGAWLSNLSVIPIPSVTAAAIDGPFSIYASTDPTASSANFASNAFWSSGLSSIYNQTYPFDEPSVTTGGLTFDGSQLLYASEPQIFLVELPTAPLPGDNLAAMGATYGVNSVPRTFQITAWATGGSANAVAVVQETYRP
ncbi:MAG: pilus assembly PilX family protein [Gammaproteobacteria bacterium]